MEHRRRTAKADLTPNACRNLSPGKADARIHIKVNRTGINDFSRASSGAVLSIISQRLRFVNERS
jgi:hypothetical protein